MQTNEFKGKLRAGGGRSYRADGYVNILNKYGTKRDNGEAYWYAPEPEFPEQTYTTAYETNGLFAKIIDIPAQEAVKTGFKLNIEDTETEDYIQGELKRLSFMKQCEEALKWARLYGGALGVMLIDDGAERLEEPVDWEAAKGIDEIVIYERAVVQPDYTALIAGRGRVNGRQAGTIYRNPEYYNVYSQYGSFRVHASRCLIFRNGNMPERADNQDFRFWGVPEYNRIHRALRETETAHGDAVKLLERMVQPIYKMRGLSNLVGTEFGEDEVLKRLEMVDASRGILNSVAIDADNEDYDFKTIALTGVADVIDCSCAMLSALTEIPQTKLFGRSPSGMNATGESDLENYYSFVDKIRQLQLRDNLTYAVEGIIQCALNTGRLTERPEYEVEFDPLWNESESEKAQTEYQQAQTDMVRAQTAQLYIDMGVLDPSEERERLKKEGKYDLDDFGDEGEPETDDELFARLRDKYESRGPLGTAEAADGAPSLDISDLANSYLDSADARQTRADADREDLKPSDPTDIKTVAVIVIDRQGRILCGRRSDDGTLAGGGGHIHEGETTEEAARREIREEFGIEIEELGDLGYDLAIGEPYEKPFIYVATAYEGTPDADTEESRGNAFRPWKELKGADLYPPFRSSLDLLRRAEGFKELRALTFGEDA